MNHPDPEPAEPSPQLLAALDAVDRDRAEREQADRIAQGRSDAACAHEGRRP